uniref:Uncharacterized protein n=1 Tax=Leersia perrieri TaxID=77586 RepID=A0A0D9XH33_9ORYZ
MVVVKVMMSSPAAAASGGGVMLLMVAPRIGNFDGYEMKKGSLEDVVAGVVGEEEVVGMAEIMPHVAAAAVAALARPRVHGRHALASQGVQPPRHVSQAKQLLHLHLHLHQMRVLQPSLPTPAQRAQGKGTTDNKE